MKSLQFAPSLSFLFKCLSRPFSRRDPLRVLYLLQPQGPLDPEMEVGLDAESPDEPPVLQIKSHGVTVPPPPSHDQYPASVPMPGWCVMFIDGLWQSAEGRKLEGGGVVVQALSRVWFFETPWTAARQTFLPFTISWNLLKLMSVEGVGRNH